MSASVFIKNVGEILLEGPYWDDKENALYFVDLFKGRIFKYDYNSGNLDKWDIGDSHCSIVIPGKGKGFVTAIENEVVLFDDWKGEKEVIARTETSEEYRFNDAKCDSRGRLWIGSYGKFDLNTLQIDCGKGVLYSLATNGAFTPHMKQVDQSNGIAWSPDEKKLFFTDSFAKTIYGFDYDIETGNVSNQSVVYKMAADEGYNDGMAMDAQGGLWVACFEGKHGVIGIDPKTGTVVQQVTIPGVSKVTSVCWGGPSLDQLMVTTAVTAGEPDSGSVFRVTGLGVTGVRQHRFYR